MAITSRQIDWQTIRDAYVKSPTRPTFAELSEQFALSHSTISNASSDEGWPILRAQFLESQIVASGAKEIILSALSCAKAIVDAGANYGLIMFQNLSSVVQDAELATRAASTRAEVLNTCSFAAANTARAMKDLGVVGFARALNEEGKSANGQWSHGMLNQINIQLSGLAAATDKAAKDIEQTVTAKVEPAETPGEKP